MHLKLFLENRVYSKVVNSISNINFFYEPVLDCENNEPLQEIEIADTLAVVLLRLDVLSLAGHLDATN